MVLRTIGRLIVVPVAFLMAAAVSGFVLVTLGLEKITLALHGKDAGPETFESVLDIMWQGTFIATGATIIPALAVVVIGEVARIRSWLYYVIGGGAALVAIPLLARADPATASALAPSAVWQLFATAGFTGGLAYWLVAGRNA
jgi:hypothetical protein